MIHANNKIKFQITIKQSTSKLNMNRIKACWLYAQYITIVIYYTHHHISKPPFHHPRPFPFLSLHHPSCTINIPGGLYSFRFVLQISSSLFGGRTSHGALATHLGKNHLYKNVIGESWALSCIIQLPAMIWTSYQKALNWHTQQSTLISAYTSK